MQVLIGAEINFPTSDLSQEIVMYVITTANRLRSTLSDDKIIEHLEAKLSTVGNYKIEFIDDIVRISDANTLH